MTSSCIVGAPGRNCSGPRYGGNCPGWGLGDGTISTAARYERRTTEPAGGASTTVTVQSVSDPRRTLRRMTSTRLNHDAIVRLQRGANETAQAAIMRVRDLMSGHPVDQVLDELVSELRRAGVAPNRETLPEYAQAITDGILTG